MQMRDSGTTKLMVVQISEWHTKLRVDFEITSNIWEQYTFVSI